MITPCLSSRLPIMPSRYCARFSSIVTSGDAWHLKVISMTAPLLILLNLVRPAQAASAGIMQRRDAPLRLVAGVVLDILAPAKIPLNGKPNGRRAARKRCRTPGA
ncbi:protein of unknown function [Paraburkholderia kururiensis]